MTHAGRPAGASPRMRTSPLVLACLAAVAAVLAGQATAAGQSAPATRADVFVEAPVLHPDPPVAEQPAVLRIAFGNNGPDAASGVVLALLRDPGFDVLASPPGCKDSGGAVTCPTGALAPGARHTLEFRIRPSGGQFQLAAGVGANQVDTLPGNGFIARTVTPRATELPLPPLPAPPQAPVPDQLPAPEPGVAANVAPLSGEVLVRVPGAGRYVRLQGAQQVPVGTLVDTTGGRVALTSAADAKGATQTAQFYGGLFRLQQPRAARPVTKLRLAGGSFAGCPGRGARGAKRRRTVRRLWGDGAGLFSTVGTGASATIRGTRWLTEDRCRSTVVRVTRGAVSVRDFARHRTVTVRAGRRYVARIGR